MMLQVKNITKSYHQKNRPVVNALSDVSVSIEKGEFVTITGPSGSGKSTLLFVFGGLLQPTSGTIHFNNQELHNTSDNALSEFRKKHIGYVMQNFSLIPYLTAEQNIMMAISLTQKDKKKQKEIAQELLTAVNLSDRMNHYPKELSAGQQQRVAIARALANNPSIILADEPTGNLDPALSNEILSLLKDLNTKKGITIIMVTHSPEAAEFGNKKIFLEEGCVVDEKLAV